MIAKRFFALRALRWSSGFVLLCGLIWGLQARPIFAQQPVAGWQPFANPPGRIRLLAQDATNQTLYAVFVSAVRRDADLTQWRDRGVPHKSHALYLSTDRGVTWQPASNNLVHGAITALYADSTSHSVFAGLHETGDETTRRDGLWRSDDNGAHWRQVNLERNDLNIRRITSNADNTLLLFGAIGGDRYPSSYVYTSRDEGKSWQSVEVLRFEDGPTHLLRDLAAHPKDPNRLFMTTYGGDLYGSTDGGATWARSSLPSTLQDAEAGPALLAIDPARPELMLLARNLGNGPEAQMVIARSQDGGASWRRAAPGGLPERGEIVSLTATGGGYLLSAGAGSYRSTDQGATWQPLEGALSGGSVATFLPLAGSPRTIIAAGGYGLFVSRDGGGLWQSLGSGLPANLSLVGLLTDARQPGVIFGVPEQSPFVEAAKPPALLRSSDGGRTWMAAAQGLADVQPGAWALDAADPNTVFIAAEGAFSRSANGGLTWEVTPLPPGPRTAMALALSDPNVLYLGGYPLLRSDDRGATWQSAPVKVATQEQQSNNVTGIVVDPVDARHLWASMEGGIYESLNAGAAWSRAGLDDQPVRWLSGVVKPGDNGVTLTVYAGVDGQGIYRRDANAPAWTPVNAGLPADSTFLSLQGDPENPDALWTNRDGGGLYRSLDGGESWASIGGALGDNLVTALAVDPRGGVRVLAATATAGIWGESAPTAASTVRGSQGTQDRVTPAVDARIEILWPHDWASVGEAQQANLSLRLFQPGSLLPLACTWSPDVTIWQATNNEPAAPIGRAEQRSVEGAPFPVWELNDVDISAANDPDTKLYFMTRVAGADSATAVWAHAADARTFLPFPAQPSGIASPAALRAVDSYIQIVWPHDEAGQPQPTESAPLANVAVAVFDHGTRLSVPASWRPKGITLYGAWDNEIARPLARQATVQMKTAGAITYPTWEFANIPVERAGDTGSKLYLWVMVEGVETYPAIWSHGADARTIFPATDQPIQGCLP